MSDAIDKTDIVIAIDEHRRAYEALRWLSNMSFVQPSWLDEQNSARLQDVQRCVDWVKANLTRLPERVRPSANRVDAFAYLFASFFQTSFRVEHVVNKHDDYYRIQLYRDQASGKARLATRYVPRALSKKRRNESQHLEYRAITLLADEMQPSFWEAARELLSDKTLAHEVTLWSWAVELVCRSRGEMHGPAVHLLWKKMDGRRRGSIDVDAVWTAREAASKRLSELIARKTGNRPSLARGG